MLHARLISDPTTSVVEYVVYVPSLPSWGVHIAAIGRSSLNLKARYEVEMTEAPGQDGS